VVAICLLLTVLPGIVTAQEDEEPPGIPLTFDWPPGFEVAVTSTKTSIRRTHERSTRSATTRYTIRVEPEGEDLRVRFGDVSLDLGEEFQAVPESIRETTAAELSELIPDFIVSGRGDFLRVRDLAGHRSRLRAFFEQKLPDDVDRSAMAGFLDVITSEASIESIAAEEWNGVVGAWADAEFVLGETYTSSREEPVLLIPGQKLLMQYSFSALRLMRCSRGGLERLCVELEMRATSDPRATRNMLDSYLAQLGSGEEQASPAFHSLQIEQVIRIVTEPRGLIPHGYRSIKTVRGTFLVEGRELAVEQIEEVGRSYSHR